MDYLIIGFPLLNCIIRTMVISAIQSGADQTILQGWGGIIFLGPPCAHCPSLTDHGAPPGHPLGHPGRPFGPLLENLFLRENNFKMQFALKI